MPNILLGVLIGLVLAAVLSRSIHAPPQLHSGAPPRSSSAPVLAYEDYDIFLGEVQAGRVASVVLQGDMIYGVRKDQTQLRTHNPEEDYTALIASLVKNEVAIEGKPPSQPSYSQQLLQLLEPLALLVLGMLLGTVLLLFIIRLAWPQR